jgi:hypothetical protein
MLKTLGEYLYRTNGWLPKRMGLCVVKNTFLDGEEHPLTEDKSKTTPCLSQRIWNTLLLDEQKLTTPAT